MTRPTPIDIGTELDDITAAIEQIVSARRRIEAAVTALAEKTARRYPTDLSVDWDEPEHIWLNALRCISPTDSFAAEVGRAVIEAAMTAHPKRVSLTVNVS